MPFDIEAEEVEQMIRQDESFRTESEKEDDQLRIEEENYLEPDNEDYGDVNDENGY